MQLDYYAASSAYHVLFRQNKPLWLAIGFILLLLIIFISPCLDLPDIFIKLVQVSRCLQMSQGRKLSSQLNSTFGEKLNNVKYKLEKRARDAQEAEQRKNDLVVYLAHDIKTPLTSIIGYLSLLDEARICL